MAGRRGQCPADGEFLVASGALIGPVSGFDVITREGNLAHCRKPDLLSLVQSLVKLCERGVDRCCRLTHGQQSRAHLRQTAEWGKRVLSGACAC